MDGEKKWNELDTDKKIKSQLKVTYKYLYSKYKTQITEIYNKYYLNNNNKFFAEMIKINIDINNEINKNIDNNCKKYNITNYIKESEWCDTGILNELVVVSVKKYKNTNNYGSYYMGYIEKFILYLCKRILQKKHMGHDKIKTINIEDLLGKENEIPYEDNYDTFYTLDQIYKCGLSDRQQIILKMILSGFTHEEIGKHFNRTPKTIQRELKEIRKKWRR